MKRKAGQLAGTAVAAAVGFGLAQFNSRDQVPYDVDGLVFSDNAVVENYDNTPLNEDLLVIDSAELEGRVSLDSHAEYIRSHPGPAYAMLNSSTRARVDKYKSLRDSRAFDRFKDDDPDRESDLVNSLSSMYQTNFPQHFDSFTDADFMLLAYAQNNISM